MSAPVRPGDLAVIHGPLVRVVELRERDGERVAVVTDDALTAVVPAAWVVPIHLDKRS